MTEPTTLLDHPPLPTGQAAPASASTGMETLPLAAQSETLAPEAFQSTLIDNMARALLRQPAPPCLLRAPTGSGKTFVIGQTLARISAERDVLWLWFVPFVTLLAQTEDALRANTAGQLKPYSLNAGRNQDAHAGMVLISTAQAVARAQSRKAGYDADGDDDTRTLAAFLARARAQGLVVGLVVDEAHIGLDKGTEFGQFARWLKADYLLMATATPKDARMAEFLAQAGYSAFKPFTVGRDEVVNARLNKKYIVAAIYPLSETLAHVADLRRTVLRQSWRRNQQIAQDLHQAGVPITPLLLVQVANGENTVTEAVDDLQRLCGVPASAIAQHTADAPDPVGMAAMAHDHSKAVLVFKQSAGTGFDAPRAFVLASTKTVNAVDFATQFIGRVMRVPQPLRAAFPKPQTIPDDLNTAYVYLGNAAAQAGFEAAVKATMDVKTALEEQTEKLEARQTVSGVLTYTNRPTQQEPVFFDAPLPEGADRETQPAANVAYTHLGEQASLLDNPTPQPHPPQAGEPLPGGWWTHPVDVLDGWKPEPPKPAKAARTANPLPPSVAAITDGLAQRGIRVYPRRLGLPTLERCLKTEAKPELDDMSAISRAVATRLKIGATLQATAIKAALNRLKDVEQRTELTLGAQVKQEVPVFIDRNALASEALAALKELPQAEDADYVIVVQVLASRLLVALQNELDNLPEGEQPSGQERQRLARDAAHWVVRHEVDTLREMMFAEIATRALTVDAQPLPDAMLFPSEIALEPSAKNIYGVLPPSKDDGDRLAQLLMLDDRLLLRDTTHDVNGVPWVQGHFDGAWFGNSLENDFSRALDRCDLVEWWHRNPRNKPYAVRVVRAEHNNYFYPDFVVCVRHFPGDEPMQRLLETKDDTKDAARKSRHSPTHFGKVLFLTPDGKRMKWVNDNGSLGEELDFEQMQGLIDQLAASRPTA